VIIYARMARNKISRKKKGTSLSMGNYLSGYCNNNKYRNNELSNKNTLASLI
jgi:hypothetical protein